MVLTLLLACSAPLEGTWLFQRVYTPPGEPSCTRSVSHNALAGTEAEDPVAEEPPVWVETDSLTRSNEAFFGRISLSETGAVLLVGEELLVGTQAESGAWTFAWTGSEDSREEDAHAAGYRYTHTRAVRSTLRLSGNFSEEGFAGTWDDEATATESWSESDVWTADAEPYVGPEGRIPLGTHVVGQDGAAVLNGREAYDCGADGSGLNACVLTVSDTCAYRTPVEGVHTELEPGDDLWAASASQAAGP